MPAHRRRLQPESTGLPPGTLATVSPYDRVCANCGSIGDRAIECITQCWAGNVYYFSAVATNESSPHTLNVRCNHSKITKKGSTRHETQRQHLARRDYRT